MSSSDKVDILGDVAWNKRSLPILSRLNGIKNSTIVAGNHDVFDTKIYLQYVNSVVACKTNYNPRYIACHIPVHSNQLAKSGGRWNFCVHGHLHSELVRMPDGYVDQSYLCVSMEQINFTPISMDEVLQIMTERGII